MEPQKQNDGVRYKLANAMKECMRTAPVEKNNRKRNCRNLWIDASDILSEFSG